MATTTLTVFFVVASAALLAYVLWRTNPGATKGILNRSLDLWLVLRILGMIVIVWYLLMSGSPYLIALAWVAILFGAAVVIGERRGEEVI